MFAKNNGIASAPAPGFTLIELTIVIVILGILAVTAAPKFFNVTKDARIASLEAVQGALKSARDLAKAKALIANVENGLVDVSGQNITVLNYYPWARDIDSLMDINASATGVDTDFQYNDGPLSISYEIPTAPDPALCRVVYNYPDSLSGPAITMTEPFIAIDKGGC
jgi:MSHA pilin protein MshA